MDQVQYAVALAILAHWGGLDRRFLLVLAAAYVWRWIGVGLCVSDGVIGWRGKRWLVPFPDLTKELLVLACFPFYTNPLAILAVVAAKVAFEAYRLIGARKTCD